MNFSHRKNLFRKSDPCQRKAKERSPNDPEYQSQIKYRGASITRIDLNRKNSPTSTIKEQPSKRCSTLEPTKLINFFKSGLSLSKFRSKSKANFTEQRQSLYIDSQSSRSEENIFGVESFLTPIRVSNIVLNAGDPTLYMNILTQGECLYKPVVVLNKECFIQPVHPSIVCGQNYCFQIIKRFASETTNTPITMRNSFESSQITKSCSYNSSFHDHTSANMNCDSVNIIRCQSAIQRKEWIMRIKKHINSNIEHFVRHEDILKIWIQEAKNLMPKKKYFCEIKLDMILYGRTTIKIVNDVAFWGEEFRFIGLENVSVISILVYKLPEAKRKREHSELVAVINLPCSELVHNSFTEKWYTPSPDFRASSDHLRYSHSIPTRHPISSTYSSDHISKAVIDSTPMLRIKARYRPLEILPTSCYEPLLEYIAENSISLVLSLENHLKVKEKEEFVNTLLLILQNHGRHIIFLSDIVITEVCKSDDNLILRGNSMASKAIECYLKLTGEKYLLAVLSDMINEVISKEVDCEVDPHKITNLKDQSIIVIHQKRLLNLVQGVWTKIYNSLHLLPEDLKSIFTMIREKLISHRRESSSSSPMIAQVISSCLFLRFICPAIMSPFLFGLSAEYSDKLCINRTFTLVAKCIQLLANFSQTFHGKESYMSFAQDFLTTKACQMRIFLNQISESQILRESTHSHNSDYFVDLPKDLPTTRDQCIDIGYQLAELSCQLSFYLREIDVKDYTLQLTNVCSIIESILLTFPSHETSVDDMVLLDKLTTRIPFPTCRKNLERRCSRRRIEDTFSYFPSDNIQRTTNCNYVDFEIVDPRFYDEPYIGANSPKKYTNILNEKEINEHWKEVVTESYHNSKDEDPNNCTINSSGYESLNLPIQVTNNVGVIGSLYKFSPESTDQSSDDLTRIIPQQINSPKFTPARQADMYRRIKRSPQVISNVKVNADAKSSEEYERSRAYMPLNTSCDKFGSFENLSASQSMEWTSSPCQRNATPSKSKKEYFKTDSSVEENENDSSIMQLFHGNSEPLPSSSLSLNDDLDQFVANELERLHLLFEYYQVPRPSIYTGNAAERYKYKTLDENNLQRTLALPLPLNRGDIIEHITASYRLLKIINKTGKMSSDVVIQSIMIINQKIQSCMTKEICKDNGWQYSKTLPNVTPYKMSTQSLPSTSDIYFGHYQERDSPCRFDSMNTTSSLNLTVLDIFDRC